MVVVSVVILCCDDDACSVFGMKVPLVFECCDGGVSSFLCFDYSVIVMSWCLCQKCLFW